MAFDYHLDPSGVTLTPHEDTKGKIGKLLKLLSLGGQSEERDDQDLAFAFADVAAIAEELGEPWQPDSPVLHLSHRLCAALNTNTASALGLPALVDRTLKTDVEGTPGSSFFNLRCEWSHRGRTEAPERIGSILKTDDGDQRIPLWMMEALDVADQFRQGGEDNTHWEALARFRQALDPGVAVSADTRRARLSLSDFLEGLEVQLTDRISLNAAGTEDDPRIEVFPFAGKDLDPNALRDGNISERDSLLNPHELSGFNQRLTKRGALPAYKLSGNKYLVVDAGVQPILELVAEKQRASADEKREFLKNPRDEISRVVAENLEARGKLEEISDASAQETIDLVAEPLFIETREFSERVIGLARYEKPDLQLVEGSGTTWLPEMYSSAVKETIEKLSKPELDELQDRAAQALEQGEPTIQIGDETVPVTQTLVDTLEARKKGLESSEDTNREEAKETDVEVGDEALGGPIVLQTVDNFETLAWRPKHPRRAPSCDPSLPSTIKSTLRQHQLDSFQWQIDCWKAGLPGVLNADEQGLGKTLQTIAFIRWLKDQMAAGNAEKSGPVLVVAPTSLLENWENEVAIHVEDPGLGHLSRLYGTAISARKSPGARGKDIDAGNKTLDFSWLHEAVEEGRAHRYWLLTTYTTLRNYQHSLGSIPFSAIVFDEIQALKNPTSLQAVAARAMQADFRIGLTGTPIENSSIDLWAIMDQLCPDALGSLKEFRERYSSPTPENMDELHQRVFKPQNDLPAIALRRIKEEVAKDLPAKTRKLHPRLMPAIQAHEYEQARAKLASKSKGAALKVLHHIRTVSVHPDIEADVSHQEFIQASGRLQAAFSILSSIRDRGERALVFIEHIKMQHRFIALAKETFGLERVDLINGNTAIKDRQAIVDRFQRHLKTDGGFDLLVLAPKAAGTGLTLTAATHVIHLSRWWNPAVEEQCNDRIHRIGQIKPVTIHAPLAIHGAYQDQSFDCLLHNLMQRKRKLAASALWPMGDTDADIEGLQSMLEGGTEHASQDALGDAIKGMFDRSGEPVPPRNSDGSLTYP